jgi:hypothetical protein
MEDGTGIPFDIPEAFQKRKKQKQKQWQDIHIYVNLRIVC